MASLLSACVSPASTPQPADAPVEKSTAENYDILFGLIGRPADSPVVVERVTSVIPVTPDGRLPDMGALIISKSRKPFTLSCVVYRRNAASGEYLLTEISPRWQLSETGQYPPGALIKPDFKDGILVGDYKFDIYIDRRRASTIMFSIVAPETDRQATP